MLQQTQVGRVLPKYLAFIERFPTIQALAAAGLDEVLVQWQSLGYNRRAKFLWRAAQMVVSDFAGRMPEQFDQLIALPGVGKNTAGAIMAYAYNQPVIFIETNIRSVYFHHFFADKTKVPDGEIANVIEQTIDVENPREFYWALMDYGTYIKKQVGSNIQQSKHYTKQSPFAGSRRQVRGEVVRQLAKGQQSLSQLQQNIHDSRLDEVLKQLQSEGLIRETAQGYRLA